MNGDLYKIARDMEVAILNSSEGNVIESPLLTKNQAEKLSYDYLFGYGAQPFPLNQDLPDISSYVVAVAGRNQNA